MRRLTNKEKLKPIFHDFHVLTLESAFLTRTFFFVLFGITIHLASLVDVRTAVISCIIIGSLYLVRWFCLLIIVRKQIIPQLYIAPRGLITILLFYAIPDGWMDFHGEVLTSYESGYDLTIGNFESGILLFTILITSLIMMISLVLDRGGKVRDVLKITLGNNSDSNHDSIIDDIEEYQVEINPQNSSNGDETANNSESKEE